MTSYQNRMLFLLLLVSIAANATGLFGTIFTGDSGLYASIAKTMADSGNYLDLYVNGRDWLDKPHLPFWLSALFIDMLGNTSFAYKLPSFLFFLLAVYYTFLLAKELFSARVGWMAAIILSTSLHIIVSNNDVRAEGYMLALMTGAVYHFYLLSKRFSHKHLWLGSFLTGCAMMTKGIFVCIPIGSAIIGPLFVRKQFGELLRWRWLFAVGLSFIFTGPELYALYQQFDLHPEKVVFNQTGVSGIRFFFWDSQFGRFFNTGPIQGKGDPFFFVHTLLWAFAPWALVFYAGLVRTLQARETEWVSFFAFIIMFVVFSASKFQLPHYTNVLMPFAAVFTAGALDRLLEKFPRFSRSTLVLYSSLLTSIIIILQFVWFQPGADFIAGLIILGLVGAGGYLLRVRKLDSLTALFVSVWVTSLTAVYLNLIFNPALLKYQSGSEAAQILNSQPERPVLLTKGGRWLLEYYYKGPIQRLPEERELRQSMLNTKQPAAVFIPLASAQSLLNNIPHKVLAELEHYHITRLKPKFLKKESRPETTQKFVLALVDPK